MNTGETLRQLRTLKGVKQIHIAKELGISQQAYSKIEKRDSIEEDKMRKLLTILGIGEEDANEYAKIFPK